MSSISSGAWLPKNVLDMIIEKFVSVSDCIRFSLVCKSWRSAVIENFELQSLNKRRHDNLHRQQIPLLMIPTDDNSHEKRGLYNVTQNKVSEQQLDVPYAKRCCGSSHGWLFTMDETSLSRLNPFSGAVIRLPALIGFYETPLVQQEDALNHTVVDTDFQEDDQSDNNEDDGDEDEEDEEQEDDGDEDEEDEEQADDGDENDEEEDDEDEEEGDNGDNNDGDEEEDHDNYDSDGFYEEHYSDGEIDLNYEYTIHKAVLSKDPDLYPDDYAVMIIYGNMYRLAFIKSGDKDWTYLHPKLQGCSDIIYSQGKFLCMRHWGDIWSCDITESPPKVEKIARAVPRYACMLTAYLAELPETGELVLVHKWLDDNLKTYGFKVMKRQVKQEQSRWVKTSDLGEAALFLGSNYSTSVLASDYPGCQPNCIYFTDDWTDSFVAGTPYEIFGGGGPCDNGFYNLKDATFGKHYKLDPSQVDMPPPIWIIPKFK